jgi:hypothetical protein
MFRNLNKFLVSLVMLSLAVGFFPAVPVRAAGANLSLSPASGTYSIGDTFNVNVVLASGGGNGVNASDGNIKFDSDYLAVKKVAHDSSVFSLWTAEPSFSNSAGTIAYSGGAPAAYKGDAGVVISITFSVLKAGSGGANFASASALAADGQGTNILANTSGAKYTFNEKAPAANKPTTPAPTTPASNASTPATTNGIMPPLPEINSTTHPDQNIWYANNNPEFAWRLLPDDSAVNYSIDKSSSTDPGKNSQGIIETKTFAGVPDGRNYFHLKYQNKSGWGPVATRQVLIDITPPTDFVINVDNGDDPTNPTPKLSFNTTDVSSGIADYKFSLDGEIKDILAVDYQKDPYKLPVLKPGAHQILISVFDQAGNSASSSKQFSVEALKPPVITSMPTVINQGEQLAIQGTSFYPDATISIYLTPDNKNIKTLTTRTDSDGNWTYFQTTDLAKNTYHVWAIVTDDRGAQSLSSTRKDMLVQSPSPITVYSDWIMISLLGIIFFLIFLIIYFNKQNKMKKKRAIREAQELEKRMNEIFAALKEEVNELMEMADKKVGYSESEKRVRDKINEALDISQEFISKEVKDVEKEIE